MRAKERVPLLSPERVSRRRIHRERRADFGVEVRDAAPPVQQGHVVLDAHRRARSAFAKRPPITRATVGNAWIVCASTEMGVRSFIASTASWIASDAAGPPMNAPMTILFFRSMTTETCPSDSLT